MITDMTVYTCGWWR